MNLTELARKRDLSPTTVARALNRYPEVNDLTRDRFIVAAKSHNCRPNTRANGLDTGRAMAVGHVMTGLTRNQIVNPIFSDFIAGADDIY
jgi:LacI family transcriptional regulator